MAEFSYDVTQYQSHPFLQTHPDRLYSIGKLFGLQPKLWTGARILELGCASGGNIIPIAYNHPEIDIVGVDLSVKQIDQGKQQIKDLGLKNIELQHRSITELSDKDGKFDFIITHGIWSWVPKEVQEKIFQVSRENLAPQGVAYISYNTLPGWNGVLGIRAMMQYHCQNFSDPKDKAAQARGLIKFIGEGLQGENTPYAHFIQNELQILSRVQDYYLLHEYLEDDNFPVYFYEFINRAKAHKLQYLSDAFVSTMYPENLPKKFSSQLKQIGDIVRLNQYMDFIRNQRFRCTLLCHEENTLHRNLRSDCLEEYWINLEAKPTAPFPKTNFENEDTLTLTLPSGMQLSTTNRISKYALYLLNASDMPIAYHDLVNKIQTKLNIQQPKVIKDTLNDSLNLANLYLRGIINISANPDRFLETPSNAPKVTELARYQALRNEPVTNLKHQIVVLNKAEQKLLPLLDGQHSHEAIIEKFLSFVQDHTLSLKTDQGRVVEAPEEMERLAPHVCQSLLKGLAQKALLVA